LKVCVIVHDEPLTVRVPVNPPCETVPTGWHPHSETPASSCADKQQALPPVAVLPLLLQAVIAQKKTVTRPNAFRMCPLE
jgi:hypothetical protein